MNELEGVIVYDLPLTEGVSKAGRAWKKKEWVMETPGMYPRRVKFHVFGDRVDYLNFEVGKSYAIQFEVESREFNGRWYTDINCTGARPVDGVGNFGGQQGGMQQPMQQPAAAAAQSATSPFGAPQGAAQPAMPDAFAATENNTDDLPF